MYQALRFGAGQALVILEGKAITWGLEFEILNLEFRYDQESRWSNQLQKTNLPRAFEENPEAIS